MEPPHPLDKGPKFLQDAFADLLKFSTASRIKTVLGGTLNETPDGMGLTIAPGSGAAAVGPFGVTVTADNLGNPAVSVAFGYIISTFLPGLEFYVPLTNYTGVGDGSDVVGVDTSDTQVFVGWNLVKTDITQSVEDIVGDIQDFVGTLATDGQSMEDILSGLGYTDDDLTTAATLLKASWFGQAGTDSMVAIGVSNVTATNSPVDYATYDDAAAVADLAWDTSNPAKPSCTAGQNIESAIYYPFAPPTQIPWLGVAPNAADTDGNSTYSIWLGAKDGDASFVTADRSRIAAACIQVDNATSGSSFSLVIGDSTPANDLLSFGGTDSEFDFSWDSGSFKFKMVDSSGDDDATIALDLSSDPAITIGAEGDEQQILLGYSSLLGAHGDYGLLIGDTQVTSGDISLSGGGSIELTGGGCEVTVGTNTKITDGDIAISGGGSIELTGGGCELDVGTHVKLTDGDLAISGGGSIELTGSGAVITVGTATTITDGDIALINDGTIELTGSGADLTVSDGSGNTTTIKPGDITIEGGGTIEMFGSGAQLTIGDSSSSAGPWTTLTAGDLALGDGGTIELTGDGCEIDVGDNTKIQDGDITLSDGGTIELAGDGAGLTVGSASLTSDTLTVATGEFSGDVDVDGDLYVGGTLTLDGDFSVTDLDASGEVSCSSLSIGGTDLDTYIKNIVSGMSWSGTATCETNGSVTLDISAS